MPSSRAGYQNSGHEVGIHTGGFQTGPQAATRHRAVRTRCHARAHILKFGRGDPQQVGRDANVAVTHDHQIVTGHCQHPLQAIDFGVGVRRFAGHDEPRWNFGKFTLQLLYYANCRIIGAADGEEDFETWIVLFKERAQIGR